METLLLLLNCVLFFICTNEFHPFASTEAKTDTNVDHFFAVHQPPSSAAANAYNIPSFIMGTVIAFIRFLNMATQMTKYLKKTDKSLQELMLKHYLTLSKKLTTMLIFSFLITFSDAKFLISMLKIKVK